MADDVEGLYQILLQQYLCDLHQPPLLWQKISLLRDVLKESYSLFVDGENKDLEFRIIEAANKAQDIVESGLSDLAADHVIQAEFGSIYQQILELQYSTDHHAAAMSKLLSENLLPNSCQMEDQIPKFGFDGQVCQLVDLIMSNEYGDQLHNIAVAMIGGSGKTTVARQLCGNSRIANHFDICPWVQFPQPFVLQSALHALVKQLITQDAEAVMHLKSDQELGEYVHHNLSDQRYLLVVDNVSDAIAWDKLRLFFPDTKNGSRVIVTTRKQSVACYVSFLHHQMQPIDVDASWKLFRYGVFGPEDDHCPTDLIEIGKQIARNCRGIPLALMAISGLLRGNMKPEFWNTVERASCSIDDSEQVDCIEEQLIKILNPTIPPSAPIDTGLENVVVGFTKDITQLVDQLTSTISGLQVIPIVGIGGSGKTTLARQVYDHSSVSKSFEIRAWVTISQAFHLGTALLGLLRCMISDKVHAGNDEELGISVSKILRDKRFIIVVDDIWEATTWDTLRGFFPDDHNGSCIILTTRELSLADYAKSSTNPHNMLPLDEDESWELITEKVFAGHEYCPTELIQIGKQIACKCRGLPLALTTVAGLLSKSKKTVDAWKRVERHGLSLINESEAEQDPYLKGIAELFCKDGGQLLDLFTSQQPQLEIIPIVGLGDSGKAALARLLYDRLLLAGSFDIHAWAMSSEQKGTQALLQNLLNSLRENTGDKPHVNEHEAVDDTEIISRVHKILYGRRYLLVLDGLKDSNTWDMLMRFFQDNNTGSRIILTATEWMVDDFNKIKPLKVDSYWEFLLQRAFEQDCGPPEMEETWMKVPGLLLSSEKTRGFWRLVEENISAGDSKNDSQIDLLSMSYDHLPPRLKPCFLYMAAFPEDYEVKVSKLVKLWMAEALVEQLQSGVHSNLEDDAETYLMDLVTRNLVYVCKRKPNGKVKTVRIHDTLWKFCQKKACEENFMWFKDLEGKNMPEDETTVCRVSIQSLSPDTDLMDLDSIESFQCIGRVSQDIDPTMFWDWQELMVLDILQYEFVDFPEEIIELCNLEYLAFTCHADIPSSISSLEYLQTLVIAKASSLPAELWGITFLRHIKCEETWIWHCPKFDVHFSPAYSLQTLSNVSASLVSTTFLKHFANLRKLGIFFSSATHTAAVNLDLLLKLETLKCLADVSGLATLSYLTYPDCLKKLTLISCSIAPEDISRIGK